MRFMAPLFIGPLAFLRLCKKNKNKAALTRACLSSSRKCDIREIEDDALILPEVFGALLEDDLSTEMTSLSYVILFVVR